MTKLEQRCKGVAKIFDDFNIKYKMKYNNPRNLHFIYQGRGWDLEITNRYITVVYRENHYINFLPSFCGITEFRKFISQNRNFMELRVEDE